MSAPRRAAAIALLAAGLLAIAACGDTGGPGYSSVQGGSGRAPGAPGASTAQPTVRPTATVAR